MYKQTPMHSKTNVKKRLMIYCDNVLKKFRLYWLLRPYSYYDAAV